MVHKLHWPGIEPGPPAWQARILPLNHQCLLATSPENFQFFQKLNPDLLSQWEVTLQNGNHYEELPILSEINAQNGMKMHCQGTQSNPSESMGSHCQKWYMNCIGRESNPALPRGRREFYHWTTNACLWKIQRNSDSLNDQCLLAKTPENFRVTQKLIRKMVWKCIVKKRNPNFLSRWEVIVKNGT